MAGTSWGVSPVAPRLVHDASCVTRVNDESHFSWQAQYLVMLRRMTSVAPRIVNDLAYVRSKKDQS